METVPDFAEQHFCVPDSRATSSSSAYAGSQQPPPMLLETWHFHPDVHSKPNQYCGVTSLLLHNLGEVKGIWAFTVPEKLWIIQLSSIKILKQRS